MDTIILDIDGVLADYRLGLLWWINVHYPYLRPKVLEHVNRKDTWINHLTLGIMYKQWLEILEDFRLSGGKRHIPPFPDLPDFLDYVAEKEFDVVLMTSRPIDIYSNIYRDTVEWLNDHSVKYSMLLWSKSKADMAFKMRLHGKTLFAVDDEWSHVAQYAELGIKTYWINHYKNKERHPLAIEIEKLSDIQNLEEK